MIVVGGKRGGVDAQPRHAVAAIAGEVGWEATARRSNPWKGAAWSVRPSSIGVSVRIAGPGHPHAACGFASALCVALPHQQTLPAFPPLCPAAPFRGLFGRGSSSLYRLNLSTQEEVEIEGARQVCCLYRCLRCSLGPCTVLAWLCQTGRSPGVLAGRPSQRACNGLPFCYYLCLARRTLRSAACVMMMSTMWCGQGTATAECGEQAAVACPAADTVHCTDITREACWRSERHARACAALRRLCHRSAPPIPCARSCAAASCCPLVRSMRAGCGRQTRRKLWWTCTVRSSRRSPQSLRMSAAAAGLPRVRLYIVCAPAALCRAEVLCAGGSYSHGREPHSAC